MKTPFGEVTAMKSYTVKQLARLAGVSVRAVGTAFNVLLGSGAVEVLVTEGKVAVVVGVTADLVKRAPAGQIVKQLAPIVGGGGGGRPDFAEAGGKDASKIPDNVGHVYKELTGKIDHSMLGRANTPDAMGPYGPARGVDVAGN